MIKNYGMEIIVGPTDYLWGSNGIVLMVQNRGLHNAVMWLEDDYGGGTSDQIANDD